MRVFWQVDRKQPLLNEERYFKNFVCTFSTVIEQWTHPLFFSLFIWKAREREKEIDSTYCFFFFLIPIGHKGRDWPWHKPGPKELHPGLPQKGKGSSTEASLNSFPRHVNKKLDHIMSKIYMDLEGSVLF